MVMTDSVPGADFPFWCANSSQKRHLDANSYTKGFLFNVYFISA